MADKSIRITAEAHKALVIESDLNPIKMGRYASAAILEKIERDRPRRRNDKSKKQ